VSVTTGRLFARWVVVAVAGLAAGALVACASTVRTPSNAEGTGVASTSAALAPGTVTVFAAASLTEVFDALAAEFEKAHPGVTVVINYGGSAGLATQLVQGAPADVFAAASPATMTTVMDAGLTGASATVATSPQVFASNTLEIAVPTGNPSGITSLRDFARTELRIALCATEVPCGAISAKAFAAANVTPAPDTLEQDVRAVLTKISLGEVDAGLVYRTDVRAALALSATTSAPPTIEGIEFSEADSAVTTYPIVALAAAPNAPAAAAFTAFVLSAEGARILRAAGFGPR